MPGLFEPYDVPAPRPASEPVIATWSKRVLVDVSHAIEQFALGIAGTEPMLVIAMFQRLAYFRREAEVYRRIAALGATTVVGIVDDLPPTLPPGVAHALLTEDEPLAREWSVTVLTPGRGATLVATDREQVRPDAVRLDAGRMFAGSWSFLREDAYRESVRLRETLRDRVDPDSLAAIDALLRAVAGSAGSRTEGSADRAARHLAERVAVGHDRIDALRHAAEEAGAERDLRSGLRPSSYLDRWLAGSAPGSAPLGVLLVHVPGLIGMRGRMGSRADRAAQAMVGGIIGSRCHGADRAVTLSDGDFAVVLPGRRHRDLYALHAALVDELAEASQHFPFVDLSASAVALVTQERPLPLAELMARAGSSPADRTLQLA